jgi:hypothetical protein
MVSSKQKPTRSAGWARRAATSLRGSNDVTITVSVTPAAAMTSAVRVATAVVHHRAGSTLISMLIAIVVPSSASTSSSRAIGSSRA